MNMKRSKRPGLGIDWLWQLRDGSDPDYPAHPFQVAAVFHDQQYDRRIAGELLDETSEATDRQFYAMMRKLAGDSRWLKFQAWLFYSLARTYGRFRWPKPGEGE